MVSRQGEKLPIARQCELLDVARASVYRKPRPVPAADLELMRLIDRQYLKSPYYGARKMAEELTRQGYPVGRKRVGRLMRLKGIEAIYRKPKLSKRHPQHLRHPRISRAT
jgi:putative transposase